MAQFLKEFDIIDGEVQEALYAAVRANPAPMQDSQLYSSLEKEKFIDLDKRLSQFKAITDPALFQLGDKLIKKLSTMDDEYNYTLVPNDITYIKYEKGGFFKAHEDYLSVLSNVVEEYTLIVCMEADCEGGRTIFHINKYFKHISDNSIKKDHCILFRKDIQHEGEILTSGTKHILTFNLWGMTKKSNTLVVTCSDGEKFGLPYSKIEACGPNFFTAMVHFQADKSIVVHKSEVPSDVFRTIYKIVMGCYITHEQLTAQRDLIKFYGIDVRFIMLDMNPTSVESPLNKITGGDDIVIFNSEETYTDFIDMVKDQDLPYVPFRILYIEGTYVFGGNAYNTPPYVFKMEPVWVSFGELNQLLYFRTVINTYPASSTKSDAKELQDSLKLTPSVDRFKMIFEEEDGEEDGEEEEEGEGKPPVKILVENEDLRYSVKGLYPNLSIGVPNLTSSEIIFTVFRRILADSDLTYVNIAGHKGITSYTNIFSIDDKNRIFFNTEQSRAILERIQSMKLEEAVKARIPVSAGKFVYPQQKEYVDENFCNESVYGNMTLLLVCGAILMPE